MDITNWNLRKVQKQCYRTAKEHGFHEGPVNIDQKLMLTVGELHEAHEEVRAGHEPQEIYHHNSKILRDKPEGFPIELADAVIRIFDLAEALGIDLQAAIEQKMNYNETRPYKHGKKF